MADNAGNEPQANRQSIKVFLLANKLDTCMWVSRIVTVLSCILFIFPIMGLQIMNYRRALLCATATSIIRSYQRSPPFQVSAEYFAHLAKEDSFHYLFYCFIFLLHSPVVPVLFPIGIFALLHASSFTFKLLNLTTPGSFQMLRRMISYVQQRQQTMMVFIASTEIILMAVVIFQLLFAGMGGILLPFLYYRFLCMRYISQRNPYSRQVFCQYRAVIEHLISSPRCPSFLRNFGYKFINVICKLCPVQVVTHQR